VVLTGCDVMNLDVYSCYSPDKGHLGPDGQPDPCHHQDSADAGTDGGGDPECDSGELIHWKLPWQAPTLLWFGPPDQVPECPLGPSTVSYEGRADLVAPPVCEACTCEPPTGSCALPSTLTARDAACGTPGAITSFNAPSPWDGHCDSTTQTPDGAAHSLTIDPMTMTESGCAPGPPVPAKVVSLSWNTFARGCDVETPGVAGPRSVCFPASPRPPGFKVCIFYDGIRECPNDDPRNTFTEQHIFYSSVQDDRQCSPCGCGAPTGSTCKAQLAVYDGNNLTCAGSPLVSIPISSAAPVCLDIALPGQALGSKSAGPTTYLPGTCPPAGGEASGSAIGTEPATLCCRP
jgi:hypothetical protein